MTDLVTTTERNLFSSSPHDKVRYAVEIANELKPIIEKQGMYVTIQGHKYVKCEGWQTLGTFLGIIPRECSVRRHDDGSYEASVDLIRFSDGIVVGGSSAICSVSEKRWGTADEYARRSMAITRAVSKAYRTAFAWVITLAGYQPTPAEEMEPVQEKAEDAKKTKTLTARLKETDDSEIYTGAPDQKVALFESMKLRGITNKDTMKKIHERFKGKTDNDFNAIVAEVTGQQ